MSSLQTSYRDDVRLLRSSATKILTLAGIAGLVALPFGLGPYGISIMNFVFIYSIAGLALMVLMGFTGLTSIGQAAFLGVGAYAEAVLQAKGWPILVTIPIAMTLAGLAGLAIGLPALRLSGIYLALSTLAFGFIVEEGLTRWESVTGGNAGMTVRPPILLTAPIREPLFSYYLALAFLAAVTLVCLNLLRTPAGRAFAAIRDSEISAQSMGVNLARYKTLSFVISAAVTGLAGALYAHQIRFITPDQFGLILSIELLMMIVVGGLGSIWGAVFGALFIVGLPEAIGLAKTFLPAAVAEQTGLQPAVFGGIMILFVLLEPRGIAGMAGRAMRYVTRFPLAARGTFARERGKRANAGAH